MSSSESEKTDEDSGEKEKEFKLLEINEIAEFETPKILDYIATIHKILSVKEKTLNKYKEKVKNLLNQVKELQTPTPPTVIEKEEINQPIRPTTTDGETTTESDKTATNASTFLDEIRQAAEQAQSHTDFVYEPTSGMYYDQKTGYYYNAEYGLYYDGNTGCYYNYNQEKNVFEFHSQVEVQPNEGAAKDKNDDTKDDDLTDDVQFDENGGVITDKEQLRRLRKAKRKKERELRRAKKKKRKSSKHSKAKKDAKKHQKKKRKRCDSRSTDTDEEKAVKKKRQHDMEDGELGESNTSSSSSSSSSEDERDKDKKDENGVPIFKSSGRFQDIAKNYPPSLRIIVQETNLEALKVGSLHLITYKGGSLGREGNHDVIIPDVNVSKSHLKFSYDRKKSIYSCIDLGSQNGTILNGTRMSVAKIASEPYDLVHGSVIQIAQTKLLCHSHEGNSTCGLCEPGLLIEAQSEKETSAPTVHLTHKEQLKRLQKRYGLENEKFVDNKQNAQNSSYNDRAATRRVKVGSSSDKEKTQMASVNTAISSENKGFKMLSKLGWSEGEALGKSQAGSGLLEPINVSVNEGKKGLGCEEPSLPVLTKADKKKLEAVQKMKERYQKTNDIFTLNDDNST